MALLALDSLLPRNITSYSQSSNLVLTGLPTTTRPAPPASRHQTRPRKSEPSLQFSELKLMKCWAKPARDELGHDELPCFLLHGENRSEKKKVPSTWFVCVLGVRGQWGGGEQSRAQREQEV